MRLPLWIGFVITVASFACGLLFVLLDYVFIVNHRRRRVENSVREGSINGVKTPLLENLRDSKQDMDDVRNIILLVVIIPADTLLLVLFLPGDVFQGSEST